MSDWVAHISSLTQDRQPLKVHCENVSELCRRFAMPFHLKSTAALIGLLHDMGKATEDFLCYLLAVIDGKEPQKHPNHAATGAVFAFDRWITKDKLTAQMIAMCICAHHAGLYDCLNNIGESALLKTLKMPTDAREKDYSYSSAVKNYLHEICSLDELDALFAEASQEIAVLSKVSFEKGMTVRLLLSFLVDADRWDAACFERGINPLAEKAKPDWEKKLNQFEEYRSTHYQGDTDLNRIRAEISDVCSEKALGETGIYRLSVPTGGGKTMTSLRFALRHAHEHCMDRIFYVIPYNTILDQNADDIRKALDDDPGILEHHANIVHETEKEKEAWKLLTERWDSEIILTSLVQFLNALFRIENSCVRRMHRLSHSVIVFDEVQSLPKQCQKLFESAVSFLTRRCGCTVVLCTATQPSLSFKPEPQELVPDRQFLYDKLRRVRYIPELSEEVGFDDAAEKINYFLQGGRSVLFIANTKKGASAVYEAVQRRLTDSGRKPIVMRAGLTDNELQSYAESVGERDILCIHLTTMLCPAHRLELLRYVKAWTKAGKMTFCASTALIEAGINVSFPIVVRSLAGLPSIIQAGGRCNRNGELDYGDVYIWSLYEEKDALRRLPDVKRGQNVAGTVIRHFTETRMDLGSPQVMDEYFKIESREIQAEDPAYTEFLCEDWKTTLFRLLSKNYLCQQEADNRRPSPLEQLALFQSFRKAGESFKVIDENTKSVIVPYGKGRELITALCGKTSMYDEQRLLNEAQAYSVNLYDNVYRRLEQEGALTRLGDTGVVALQENWYDESLGVRLTPRELDVMIL